MKYVHLIALLTFFVSCQENQPNRTKAEISHKEYPYQIDSLIPKPIKFYPILTNDKTLYFNSDKSGNSDLYFSKYVNGDYTEPIGLPDNINSPRREADAFIARDESYLIFVRVDEADGLGQSDLYISFKIGDNEWTDPKNMGSEVNSHQIDGSPYITPNGKFLVFTSGRLEENIKQKAIESYETFKSLHASSANGSLNFYIMSF